MVHDIFLLSIIIFFVHWMRFWAFKFYWKTAARLKAIICNNFHRQNNCIFYEFYDLVRDRTYRLLSCTTVAIIVSISRAEAGVLLLLVHICLTSRIYVNLRFINIFIKNMLKSSELIVELSFVFIFISREYMTDYLVVLFSFTLIYFISLVFCI